MYEKQSIAIILVAAQKVYSFLFKFRTPDDQYPYVAWIVHGDMPQGSAKSRKFTAHLFSLAAISSQADVDHNNHMSGKTLI
jgi:hypothetical protein